MPVKTGIPIVFGQVLVREPVPYPKTNITSNSKLKSSGLDIHWRDCRGRLHRGAATCSFYTGHRLLHKSILDPGGICCSSRRRTPTCSCLNTRNQTSLLAPKRSQIGGDKISHKRGWGRESHRIRGNQSTLTRKPNIKGNKWTHRYTYH